MKKFILNISLVTRKLLLLFIIFLGFIYANAANNTSHLKKTSYDATNLKAAFHVLKMRIESERDSLKKINNACNEMDTKEEIERKVEELDKLYTQSLSFSNSFNERLRKDEKNMSQLDTIRSKLVKMRQNSNENLNIICKASKENTPNIANIKKALKETQLAAEKSKNLLSKMKEISRELYDSLSNTPTLLKNEFKKPVEENIFGWGKKCRSSGVPFERQVLLGMIPEKHLEIKIRYLQARKLLAYAEENNYKHSDIYQARFKGYSSFVNKDTPLYNKYSECEKRHNYLSKKCDKLNDELHPKVRERYNKYLKLVVGFSELRKEQMTRLKNSVKSMGENVAMIYSHIIDADQCMGKIDLNKTTSINTSEVPAVSPAFCTCSTSSIEVGQYEKESDCLNDQKIWAGDLVTWSQKNGGTCFRCPEEDVDCGKTLASNPEAENQPEYISGTIWEVWGPIPYGYGTKCFTSQDISLRMKPGTKKDKDGWLGSKGGGTMRPTGQSCRKLLDSQNTPGDSNLDPNIPNSINLIEKKAEKLHKKAHKLWEEGKLKQGIDQVSKVQKLVPNDKKIKKTLTAMKRQKQKLDKKLKNASEKIRKNKLKEAERILVGAAVINDKYPEYTKTRQELNDAKKKAKENKRAEQLQRQAKDLWDKGDLAKAIETMKRASQIVPNNAKIIKIHKAMKNQKKHMDNVLSECDNFIGQEEYKKAERTLKKAERISSNYPPYVKMLDKLRKAKEKSGQVNGTLWDVWGPIPYGYGKKCLTETEVTQQIKPGSRPNKNGWYASKNGGTMKPTGKSCTKPRSSVGPSSGYVVVTNVVGLSKKQAEKKFKEIGLNTKIVIGDPAPSKKSGLKVQKSIPTSGKTIKRGSTVTLVVHPPFVDRRSVPSLTSDSESEVIKKIKNAGLIPRIGKVKATSASQSGKISSVKPPSGTEVLAGSTVFVDVFDTYDGVSNSDPWVDKVVSFTRPPGSSDEGFGAESALGAPITAKFVAIDKPETIVFVFTDNVVIDGEGNDLKLHEYVNGDSRVEVFVSADNSRYISLGKTAKSAEYDLANYGLSTVRYVKLVGLEDGGGADGYDLMAIEALNSSPDKTIIFVDTVEDFGSKSIKTEVKCEKYNECLTKMIQEIQQLSLNMASGQSMSFGCKYLGLGEAIAKVAQDANFAGCNIAGNYAHTGDMIKATAGQMCAGQSIAFDINKFASCSSIGTNLENTRKPTGSMAVRSDSVDDFNAGKVTKVPNVIGLSIREASEIIKSVGLDPSFKLGAKTNDPGKNKTVFKQKPTPGTKIKPGGKVKMSIYTLKQSIRQDTYKPNWDNGCYGSNNTGGATLQWTLRDPPPYSGLTPICSDRDGELWILNNHISKIMNGKLDRYGCYSGSTVKAKNRDYRGKLCRPKGYTEGITSTQSRSEKIEDYNIRKQKYPLSGGVTHLDIPRKILGFPLTETYFLSEWNVSKTFKGGHLSRPLSSDIDSLILKEMGTHMVSFTYEVSNVNAVKPFGMVLVYFWLESNDPIMQNKMQNYMKPLCTKRNMYIREVENNKKVVVRKDLTVYSPNTWSGIYISMPQPLFSQEDSLIKTMTELLIQLEPYAKRCN